MDVNSGAIMAMSLGFLLGLKHATDADHVVAVSTIASEFGNAWRGIWIGVSWGLGHTTPLLVLGAVILLAKETVVERYAAVAPALEFGVGVMLVVLGVQVFWNLKRRRLHIHGHQHGHGPQFRPGHQFGDLGHLHVHGTHAAGTDPHFETKHGIFRPSKPEFRAKSYAIGIVHGFAGSAAVMLVLLPQIDSIWVGMAYLLLFGVGTIISMALITVVLSVPFAVGGRFRGMERGVAGAAGGASVAFGVALMSDLALGTSLIPF
jgi:ABC-type nickel/cobalt efflux system permease component RcnA